MFKTFKFWNELFIMIIGLIVGAAAVYYFLVPSKIIIGTVSGLAMVLNSLVPFIKVSQFVLILNVILVILAIFKIKAIEWIRRKTDSLMYMHQIHTKRLYVPM